MIERDENYNRKWNERSLAAWEEWKRVCSIFGCSAANRQLLATEVANAFKRKFYSCCGGKLNFLFSSVYRSGDSVDAPAETASEADCPPEAWADDSNEADGGPSAPADEDGGFSGPASDADSSPELPDFSPDAVMVRNDIRLALAHEFDTGIIEKANAEKKPKNYKDYTWQIIAERAHPTENPPLRIIHGKLTGPRSIINEIAERYIRNNFPEFWKIDRVKPADGRPGDSDDEEKEDVLPVPSEIYGNLAPDDLARIEKCFRGVFSNREAAVFLVFLTQKLPDYFPAKISYSDSELMNYTGWRKTQVYDRLNNVVLPRYKALSLELWDLAAMPGFFDFLIFLLKKQIRPEKKSFPLLQKIERETRGE